MVGKCGDRGPKNIPQMLNCRSIRERGTLVCLIRQPLRGLMFVCVTRGLMPCVYKWVDPLLSLCCETYGPTQQVCACGSCSCDESRLHATNCTASPTKHPSVAASVECTCVCLSTDSPDKTTKKGLTDSLDVPHHLSPRRRS